MTFIVYEPLSEIKPTFPEAKVVDFVEVESYNYIKHRCGIGSFTLVVPNGVNGLKLIKPDMLLLVLDEYVDDSLVITSVKDEGLHTTIRGYDAKYLLKWRVTLFPQEEIEAGTYGYDVATGTTGQIIQHYIEYNAGEEAAEERQIYGLVCGDMTEGIAEDTYMSRMEPLNEVVEALCENADIGYSVDIVRSGNNIGYVVSASAGTDRTNGQSENSKVVFAEYTFSANGISAETSTEERKNLIWAINGGTVDDATVTAVNNSEEEDQPAGFLRREIVATVNCDAEDVEIYAKKDADGYTDKTEITVEAAIYSDYGQRYLVGDLVTVMKNGKSYDKRILSAEKSYSGQSKRVSITLGDIPEKRVIERLNYETSRNKAENITQRLDGPAASAGGTGKFLDAGHTSVAHNDLENNTSEGTYDSVDGYYNTITGSSSKANTVTGEYNTVTTSQDNIVSGNHNTVTASNNCNVSGMYNTVSQCDRSVITGMSAAYTNCYSLLAVSNGDMRVNNATRALLVGSIHGARVDGEYLPSGGQIYESEICGYNIEVTNSVAYSAIFGTNQTIGGQTAFAVAVFGQSHKIMNNPNSTLVSGAGNTVSSEWRSIITGEGNIVQNGGHNIVTGNNNTVTNSSGCSVFGQCHTVSNSYYATLIGQYGQITGGGIVFAIGGGTLSGRANIFEIDNQGNVTASGTITPGGADYAECCEWADGNPNNEDRCGLLVTLRGDMIVPAHGDDIIGVISGRATVIGNAFELYWHGKYLTDAYGRILTDENGDAIISPEYDPDREYIPRLQRPEWDAVGLVGRLIVRDNGKCAPDGYVSARNGTAVPTSSRTGVRVLKRVDETHVEVLIK